MANMPLDDIMIGIDHERTRVDVPSPKIGMHIGGVNTLQELCHLDKASHKHKSTMLKEPNDKL